MVEDAGETAAFVVLQLRDIAPAAWEPRLPGLGTGGAPAGQGARPLVQVGQVGQVGQGEQQRMLPLLDLVQRMRDLRCHRQAA